MGTQSSSPPVGRRAVACMCLAALALVGCPGGGLADGPDPLDPDAGSGSHVVDVGCATDGACAAGEICDVAAGVCIAGLDCTANPGICGFCDDPTLGCGPGVVTAYCSSSAGVCRRQGGECAACTIDDECAAAESGQASVCRDGACAVGCGACPAGFQCESGGCVPPGGMATCATALTCAIDDDCPTGASCSALAVCVALCDSDAACAAGEICETAPGPRQHQCVPGCPLGETVEQDGVLLVCHADGHYAAPCPTDGSDVGCTPGSTCDAAGICQLAGCQNDAECPLPRTFCDISTSTCVEGCNDDGDCGAFELCETGTCAAQGCRSKELSCNLLEWCCGAEHFSDASTCPAGVADGACFLTPDPWCRTCEDDSSCADIAEAGQTAGCYDLQREDENGNSVSVGKFCSVGCSSNDDCPRGVDCVHDLPTDQEGVTRSGCISARCAALSGAP